MPLTAEEKRDRQRQRHQRWRNSHREQCNAQRKRWRARHVEWRKEYDSRWRKSHREQVNALTAGYRARKLSAATGKVDYKAIIVRDKMICGICHKRVVRQDLAFDHIIPLTCGGSHTEDNIQVTHRSCNSAKGRGRLPSQTRLVI